MRGNPYLPKACYMLSKLVLSASTQETYHYLHFTDGKKKKGTESNYFGQGQRARKRWRLDPETLNT